MICPKCESENCHYVSHSHTSNGSICNGCCGYIFLGPLGILCGLCGSSTDTKEFWVCNDCGAKFQKGLKKKSAPPPIRISPPVQSNQSMQATQNVQTSNNICPKCGRGLNALGRCNYCEATEYAANQTSQQKTTETAVDFSKPSTANILNKSLAAVYGEYFYYADYDDIVRVHNGTRTKVHADLPSNLFADERGLYFVADGNTRTMYTGTIYFLPHNSTRAEKVSDAVVKQMCYYKGSIYYINAKDKNSVYRTGTSAWYNAKILSGNFRNLVVYNDKMFYLDKARGRNVYSYDLNTKIETLVISIGKIERFCISDDVIYYSRTGVMELNRLYYLDLPTGASGFINEFVNEFCQVANRNVYLCNENTIFEYSIDNRSTLKYTLPYANSNKIDTLNIAGDYIYYGNAFRVYGRVKVDGSGHEKFQD